MRNLILTTILLLIAQSFVSAQIKVNSSGNVAIGNANPNSNKLYLIGTAQLKTGTSNGIYIDNSGYSNSPAIYGCANVGKSNSYCYAMYSSYYYGDSSDVRLKENIRNITNGLDLVLKINGFRFDYKNSPVLFNTLAESGQNDALIDSLRKNHVGYIAQDVINIIPEAVGYDKIADIYTIDYTKFIPFITEAIKEQQLIIQRLQLEIQELKSNSIKND